MTLFSQLPVWTSSILDSPLAKAKYDSATGEVTWDLGTPARCATRSRA